MIVAVGAEFFYVLDCVFANEPTETMSEQEFSTEELKNAFNNWVKTGELGLLKGREAEPTWLIQQLWQCNDVLPTAISEKLNVPHDTSYHDLGRIYNKRDADTFRPQDEFVDSSGEIIVELADGWTLKVGMYEPETKETGNTPVFRQEEYVRLCRPDGSQYAFWDLVDRRDEPVRSLRMFMMYAAGFRQSGPPKNETREPGRRRLTDPYRQAQE